MRHPLMQSPLRSVFDRSRASSQQSNLPPYMLIAPYISGVPTPGNTLTLNRGSYGGAQPLTFSDPIWQIDQESFVGTNTYEVQDSDIGKYIRVIETVTNDFGSWQEYTESLVVTEGDLRNWSKAKSDPNVSIIGTYAEVPPQARAIGLKDHVGAGEWYYELGMNTISGPQAFGVRLNQFDWIMLTESGASRSASNGVSWIEPTGNWDDILPIENGAVVGCHLKINSEDDTHTINFQVNGVWGSPQSFTISGNTPMVEAYDILYSPTAENTETSAVVLYVEYGDFEHPPSSGKDWLDTWFVGTETNPQWNQTISSPFWANTFNDLARVSKVADVLSDTSHTGSNKLYFEIAITENNGQAPYIGIAFSEDAASSVDGGKPLTSGDWVRFFDYPGGSKDASGGINWITSGNWDALTDTSVGDVIGCQLTIDNSTGTHSIRFSINGGWGSTEQFTISNDLTATVPYRVIVSASSTAAESITYESRFSAAEQSYEPDNGWDWNKTTQFFSIY